MLAARGFVAPRLPLATTTLALPPHLDRPSPPSPSPPGWCPHPGAPALEVLSPGIPQTEYGRGPALPPARAAPAARGFPPAAVRDGHGADGYHDPTGGGGGLCEGDAGIREGSVGGGGDGAGRGGEWSGWGGARGRGCRGRGGGGGGGDWRGCGGDVSGGAERDTKAREAGRIVIAFAVTLDVERGLSSGNTHTVGEGPPPQRLLPLTMQRTSTADNSHRALDGRTSRCLTSSPA